MLAFDPRAVARFVGMTFERHLAEGFCDSCVVRIWGNIEDAARIHDEDDIQYSATRCLENLLPAGLLDC